MEKTTEQRSLEKMSAGYETLISKIRSGESISKTDKKFMKSFEALLNALDGKKPAGNAGKRKPIKTGK